MAIRFSFKPLLRKDKPVKENGTFPINYLVRIGGKQIKIPSKKEIEENYWDKKSGKARKTYPNAPNINSLLAKAENDFRDFVLKQELQSKYVGIQEVKNYFNGDALVSFYDFFKEIVKVKKLKPNTIKVYNTTYTVLKQFRPNLTFPDLTPMLIRQFNHFLLNVRGNNNGGIYNRHKILKCIILEAIKNDLMVKSPYIGFPIRKVSSKKTYLNFTEIKKLEDVGFSEKKTHLYKIRDIFLFSCYTGIRFSDVLDLGWANIKDNSLDFKMNKTGKFISIPLISKAKEIIARYEAQNETYIFPIISNQKANKYLKEIALFAGIEKYLTFHVSRHSFASNLVAKDVQLYIVRDLLGHSSVKETEVYAKNNRENIVNAIYKLDN